MTVLVADAGPLIALAAANILERAVDALDGLIVPRAVLTECTHDPASVTAQLIAQLADAHAFQIVEDEALFPFDPALAHGLGHGELAVLGYAKANQLIALLDERRARRAADRLGISYVGTGGVLLRLKATGHIADVRSVLAAWEKHGYWVSTEVQAQLLSLAGESA